MGTRSLDMHKHAVCPQTIHCSPLHNLISQDAGLYFFVKSWESTKVKKATTKSESENWLLFFFFLIPQGVITNACGVGTVHQAKLEEGG